MGRPTTRDWAAAGLYGVFAVTVLLGSVMTASVPLAALSAVLFVAAIAALRGYPIDRTW